MLANQLIATLVSIETKALSWIHKIIALNNF